MKSNHYFINDRQALWDYVGIKEETMEMMNEERESDNAQKKLIATTDRYMWSDRGAFLVRYGGYCSKILV